MSDDKTTPAYLVERVRASTHTSESTETRFVARYRPPDPVRMYDFFAGSSHLDHDPKEAQCEARINEHRDEYSMAMDISLNATCNLDGLVVLRECVLRVLDQLEAHVVRKQEATPTPAEGDGPRTEGEGESQ